MKIQLKRSNQLDGGAAKQPTVAQMEYGELAVNYNDEDPAIFIKDSDDNIIRIAGVGSISSGDVPSGGSGDKPDAPSLGDLYFDTDLNILLYWNGNEWIEISPTLVADGSTAALPDATEHGEGTLWWDSDAASGKLFICYDDPGQGKVWVEASPMPNGGALPDISDPNNQGGTLDTRYVRADVTDHKQGNLTIGDGPGNNNIRLNEDGSALFADGDLSIRGSDGMLFTSGDLRVGGNVDDPNIFLRLNGSADFVGAIKSGNPTSVGDSTGVNLDGPFGEVAVFKGTGSSEYGFRINNQTTNTNTVELKSDGSATFAGDISVNGTNSNDSAFYISDQGFMNVRRKDASGTRASLCVNRGGTEVVFAGYNSLSSSAAETAQINADGSASFAGDITAGDYPNPEAYISASAIYANVNPKTATVNNSGVSVYQDGANNGAVILRNTAGDDQIVMTGTDGNAEFAGSGNFYGPFLNLSLNNTENNGVFLSSGDLGVGNRPKIDIKGAGGTALDANQAITISHNNGANTVFECDYSGSASFAGDVQVGEFDGANLANEGSYIYSSGQFRVSRISDGGESKRVFSAFEDGTQTVDIRASGSASFAGDIVRGKYENDQTYVALRTGQIEIGRVTDILDTGTFVSTRYSEDGNTREETIKFTTGGTADFAGKVSIDGGSEITASNSQFASTVLSRWTADYNTVGGTVAEINADGSANFANNVVVPNSTAADRCAMTETGINAVRDTADAGKKVWSAFGGATETSIIYSDGSARFAGNKVDITKDGLVATTVANSVIRALSISNTDVNADYFGGRVFQVDVSGAVRIGGSPGNNPNQYTSPNIALSPNGSADFAGTVTANGTILTRTGGTTLDVGDRLEKADAALQTLKTAAAAAADFAELKAAIATALADI